ncbi:unnamed protein product, partial [Dibothriocephalus latus]
MRSSKPRSGASLRLLPPWHGPRTIKADGNIHQGAWAYGRARENSDGRLGYRDRHPALGEEVSDISHELREELRSLIDLRVSAEEHNITRVRYHFSRCPKEWELLHVDVDERQTEHRALRKAA